ncbi:MAG: glycosyltransferase family 25 protein [Acetobacteraceae bacterium]
MSAPAPPPVFVINLARDTARRTHMAGLLARVGLSAEFVAAVDGRSLSKTDRARYDPVRALRVYGKPMLDAEIACYLSHDLLWQRLLDQTLTAALILEDDIDIDPSLPGLIADLLVCPDWLVVRLHSMRGRVLDPHHPAFLGRRVAGLRDGAGLFRLRTHTLGAAAYLIRAEGARRLRTYGQRIVLPVDQTMDRFWENGIAPYVVRPFPVRQRAEFASSIGARTPDRLGARPLDLVLCQRLQRAGDGVRKRLYLLTS